MKKSKNRGITLVALVVTIIILLILAGVAISALTQTGLFENAKQAKNAMENAQNVENVTLGSYNNKIDSVIGSREESKTEEQNEIEKLIRNQEYQPGDVIEMEKNAIYEGFISSSKKKLWFSILLGKNISKNVTRVEVNTQYFDIRHSNGGYLINSAASSQANGYTKIEDYFVVDSFSNNCITLRYDSNNAFDCVNNTPISVNLKNMTIKFY